MNIIIVNKPGLFSRNNIPNMINYSEIHILSKNVVISNNAFDGCNNLKYIEFNDDTNLGIYSFHQCSNLELNKLPLCEIIPAFCFFGCIKIEKLEIPSTVFKIDYASFKNSGLKTIIFNEGLKIIEDFAFMNTKINFCVFPKSIEKISKTAFVNSDLNVIYCYIISKNIINEFISSNEYKNVIVKYLDC